MAKLKSFMVEIDLPEDMDYKFWQKIPEQRKFIGKMLKDGVITDYSLSMDRQKLWVILNTSNKKEACMVIESFPIRPYINYSIYNLLFHDRNNISSPQLWLN